MIDRERVQSVLATLEDVAGLELDDGERIRQPPEERLEVPEEVTRALRSVHRQPDLVPTTQRKCLQHPRQAEDVVAVEMRQVDLLDLGQPHRRALQLALRSLRAIEQQALASASQQ